MTQLQIFLSSVTVALMVFGLTWAWVSSIYRERIEEFHKTIKRQQSQINALHRKECELLNALQKAEWAHTRLARSVEIVGRIRCKDDWPDFRLVLPKKALRLSPRDPCSTREGPVTPMMDWTTECVPINRYNITFSAGMTKYNGEVPTEEEGRALIHVALAQTAGDLWERIREASRNNR